MRMPAQILIMSLDKERPSQYSRPFWGNERPYIRAVRSGSVAFAGEAGPAFCFSLLLRILRRCFEPVKIVQVCIFETLRAQFSQLLNLLATKRKTKNSRAQFNADEAERTPL